MTSRLLHLRGRMRWLKILARLALVATVWAHSFAHATSAGAIPASTEVRANEQERCQAALAQFSRETGAGVLTPLDHVANESSIEFVSSRPGRWGGLIYRVRMKPDRDERLTWASDFAQRYYDNQGDPRWFIYSVGPETAAFSGFRMMSATEMELPDATEFINARGVVNRWLLGHRQRPFPFGFFAARSNADVRVGTYVKNVAYDLAQPIAVRGHHLLHDLAYHAAIIFAPDAFAEAIQGSAHLHVSFFEFLKRKYANDARRSSLIEDLEYVSHFRDTVRFDVFTGKLTFWIAQAEPSAESVARVSLELHKAIDLFQRTPGDLRASMLERVGVPTHLWPERGMPYSEAQRFLADLLWIQNPDWIARHSIRKELMNEQKFNRAIRSARDGYPSQKLAEDYLEFVRGYDLQPGTGVFKFTDAEFPGYSSRVYDYELYPELNRVWTQTFCHDVQENKRRWINAVREIEREGFR